MKKQILTISVVIALMFLATLPTTSSYANETGKVFSDGYVELTLNKMERTDTVPLKFIMSPFARAYPPEAGHDFVLINLTATRIEGRYVVLPSSPSILFDDKGDNYTCGGTMHGITLRTEKGETQEEFTAEEFAEAYTEAVEGSEWLLYSEMPKDREPIRLRFFYNFTESWEKVSLKEGQMEGLIEIDLQVTPTPTVTPVPHTPTLLPTPSPTATVTEIPTPEEKGMPGFEVIFAIAGLLALAHLLRRRK